MAWLLLEALFALALLVGAVLWVVLPPRAKKGRGTNAAPPEKTDLKERREEISGLPKN